MYSLVHIGIPMVQVVGKRVWVKCVKYSSMRSSWHDAYYAKFRITVYAPTTRIYMYVHVYMILVHPCPKHSTS